MKVKINAPTVIQIQPNTYDLIARGHKNNLQNKYNLTKNDRIRIKEHTGEHYTGNEILAIITKTTDEYMKFKKISITSNKELGKQNKRDVGRKSRQNNVYNSYI